MSRRDKKVFYAIMVLLFVFLLLSVLFDRGNALEVSRALLLMLWLGLFPLLVIGLLYYCFRVFPRWSSEGSAVLPDARPAFRSIGNVMSSLFVAGMLVLLFRSLLVVAIDRLNTNPVEVESVISRIGYEDTHPLCSVRAHLVGSKDLGLCVQRSWCLSSMQSPRPLKRGEAVYLLGRQSWAGTVIDEIKRAPNQSFHRIGQNTASR